MKKFIAIIMILLFAAFVVNGCAENETVEPATSPSPETNAASDSAENLSIDSTNSTSTKDGDKDTLIFSLTSPATLDPAHDLTLEESIILVNMCEGLVGVGENKEIIPGVAESWDISEDGCVYTFYLRDGALWSDDNPVVAEDFAYSWKRTLDPVIGSPNAYLLYPIKGGEAYNKSIIEVGEIGIDVIDKKTLKVTLENPTEHFLSLLANPIFFPLRSDIITASPNSWANGGTTYISNGKYNMSEWKTDESLLLSKNETYWNSGTVKLKNIAIHFTDDTKIAYKDFAKGKSDMVYKVPAEYRTEWEKSGEVKFFPYNGVYFCTINFNWDESASINQEGSKALEDERVRRALSLCINRADIEGYDAKSGYAPAHGYVPESIASHDGSTFGFKKYFPPTGNIEKAISLLTEAGFYISEDSNAEDSNSENLNSEDKTSEALFNRNFPKLTLSHNHEDKELAAALKDMWKENLGIEVNLNSENRSKYLLALHNWTGAYSDALAFLEIWASNSGQNKSGYKSAEYDIAIAAAKKESDPAKREAYMHEAEDYLMRDLPVIPIFYWENRAYGIKPYVTGVKFSPAGLVYFDQAEIK